MNGSGGRLSHAAFGLCVLALVAFGAGCDWFKGSESVLRVAPFLSSLSLSPTTVVCEQPLRISFRYDDPQNDISLMTLAFEHVQDQETVQEAVIWDAAAGLDLTVAGRVSFLFTLSCDNPSGRWDVSIVVEDNRGHVSNSLTGEINLTSSASL